MGAPRATKNENTDPDGYFVVRSGKPLFDVSPADPTHVRVPYPARRRGDPVSSSSQPRRKLTISARRSTTRSCPPRTTAPSSATCAARGGGGWGRRGRLGRAHPLAAPGQPEQKDPRHEGGCEGLRGTGGETRRERPVPHRGHVQPATGACSNPAKADGAACNDGNACTQTDTCQAGTCTGREPGDLRGARPVPRPRAPATGDGRVLEPGRRRTGTSCNDGNACTQTDTCQAGTCTGGNPVTCRPRISATSPAPAIPRPACARTRPRPTARVQRRQRLHADRHLPGRHVHRQQSGRLHRSDQCHVAGTCNPATGAVLEPGQGQRHRLQRRQRLHADRHLPGGPAPARIRSPAPRSTSATPRAPATRRPACAPIPAKAERHRVQRRQRLHADRHLRLPPPTPSAPRSAASLPGRVRRGRTFQRRQQRLPRRRQEHRAVPPLPRPVRRGRIV